MTQTALSSAAVDNFVAMRHQLRGHLGALSFQAGQEELPEMNVYGEALENLSVLFQAFSQTDHGAWLMALATPYSLLPHKGSLQHLGPVHHSESSVHLVTGSLNFMTERLGEEHFRVVPGFNQAEALSQLVAAQVYHEHDIGSSEVPTLGPTCLATHTLLDTQKCHQDAPWAIALVAGDSKARRFAAVGLVGHGKKVTLSACVTGTRMTKRLLERARQAP